MIILSHADARTYCLGVAQLIPVFLIALSVLDKSDATSRSRQGIEESLTLEQTARERLVEGTKEFDDLKKLLAAVDEKLAEVDSIDTAQSSTTVVDAIEESRRELADSRATLAEALDQWDESRDNLRKRADLMPNVRSAIIQKLEMKHFLRIGYGILLGVAGEVIVLWGRLV